MMIYSQPQQQQGQDVQKEEQPPNTTALSCHAIPFTLPSRLFGNNNNNNKLLLLHCIDCHAAGEPARVVVAGFPRLPASAATAQDKRMYIRTHLDWIRQVLLQEPRGYPCQNVNFVFRNDNDNDDDTLQYVIAEQGKIYPLMSGHNTICVATALVECGIVKASSSSPTTSLQQHTEFTLYAPAGPIPIRAAIDQNNNNNKVTSITLTNAPSFVQYMDITVDVPHIGKVAVDIAYSGMWYCVVRVDQFGTISSSSNDSTSKLHVLTQLDNPQQGREFCRLGEMIKQACREQYPVQHPNLDYPGVDILVFCGTPVRTADTVVEARNVVIMSNHAHFNWKDESTWTAMIDRSPCGTGTCAVMAVLHARGVLHAGTDTFVHTSIVGSKFTGRIVDTTSLLDSDKQQRTAIIPEITGSAYITQYSQVVVDPDDPFPHGFRVGDIW